MIDARICRHPLGYLEAANKPDPDALRAYYAERYFQSEQGNYRANYSELELRYIDNKVHQKAEMVRELCLTPGGECWTWAVARASRWPTSVSGAGRLRVWTTAQQE